MGNVILAGARTPIGKLSGVFSSLDAKDLGALAISEALRRAGVSPDAVDYVVLGQVLQAGQGNNPARQAAVGAQIPMTVPASTINKVCLSGLNAVYLADLMINAGDAEIVIAGGMESMTKAPYLLPGARGGYRFGNSEVLDVIMADGLLDVFEHLPMGAATERYAKDSISREDQDRFAASSHEKASLAMKRGRLAEEIVPVSVQRGRGDPLIVEEDEGVRPETTAERLGELRPAFSDGGSITAGNASQISDGAAALIVTTKEKAESLGVEPLAEIVGYGQVAGPDASLLHQPSRAIRRAVERAGLELSSLDAIEINEAFATVALASIRDLGVDESIVNVNGGAIALGHPIGMSGARLALTLAYELSSRGGGVGAAALCGGGGQGDAIVLRGL